jgi:hypothetical protein
MIGRRFLELACMLTLVSPLAFGSVSCAGGQSEPQLANVQPGEMPAGGEWTGVYYSQTYGMLHLIADGSSVNGAWRTTAGDSWGELYGKIEGNLLKHSWTEHKIGHIGAGANRTGKGYFRYVEVEKGEPHQLQGQWGLGEDEVGNSWDAIKQLNVDPDPDSVKPDEIEGRVQGGGWDSEGAEGGGDDNGGSEEEEGSRPEEGMGDEGL